MRKMYQNDGVYCDMFEIKHRFITHKIILPVWLNRGLRFRTGIVGNDMLYLFTNRVLTKKIIRINLQYSSYNNLAEPSCYKVTNVLLREILLKL